MHLSSFSEEVDIHLSSKLRVSVTMILVFIRFREFDFFFFSSFLFQDTISKDRIYSGVVLSLLLCFQLYLRIGTINEIIPLLK